MRLIRRQMEIALEEIRRANAENNTTLRAGFAREYGEALCEDWDALEKECDRLRLALSSMEGQRNELQDRLNQLGSPGQADSA